VPFDEAYFSTFDLVHTSRFYQRALARATSLELDQAAIKPEKCNADILLISLIEDEIWPSVSMVETIQQRLVIEKEKADKKKRRLIKRGGGGGGTLGMSTLSGGNTLGTSTLTQTHASSLTNSQSLDGSGTPQTSSTFLLNLNSPHEIPSSPSQTSLQAVLANAGGGTVVTPNLPLGGTSGGAENDTRQSTHRLNVANILLQPQEKEISWKVVTLNCRTDIFPPYIPVVGRLKEGVDLIQAKVDQITLEKEFWKTLTDFLEQ
jgi:hypothetical protein